MDAFKAAYAQLNTAQKQAVDALDGPVLVLAGPGTGKTQLLSARVANILMSTDTPPQNILCLTFTESGSANMRERLTRFIGQAAYDVNIGTYHSFGGDLIKRYPEYFTGTRLQNPVDELGKRQILLAITDGMSYTNPLKQTRHHLGDLMSTISEVKRALLTPEQLRDIARENLAFMARANPALKDIFADFKTMPRTLAKAEPYFMRTLELLKGLVPEQSVAEPYGSLAAIAAAELSQSLADAAETGKTTPLTKWKNDWLVKDDDNTFLLAGELTNQRIRALATVLEQYQSALAEQGLYDFDDMIIRSIEAMEKHANLRYTLQERYLYILLDEFQDTNAAQLRLIELLTNNPVNEGRPNVMAVGDDDQAIYAFQGAQYSNMLDYYRMYRDVLVVGLTENYRSHRHILKTAHNVAGQIDARLHHNFEGMSKTLEAANTKLPPSATLERVEFLSTIAEREWIARGIRQLIEGGVSPREIAVLAPKHKHLEPLVPYLNNLGIPVRYEKRENILEAPVVRQLITMSQLILALEANNQALANHLWPQVLSYDFWGLPTSTIWQIAWQVSDSKEEGYSWSRALLDSADCRVQALLLLGVAGKVHTETAETLLDYLMGNAVLDTNDPATPTVTSPLRDFYTSAAMQTDQPELFYETVSHLTVLRAHLRDHQQSADAALTLHDFVAFVQMYDEAEQQLINTSPYSQQADAVELMTVFKAKGLEFAHVFLPSCQDDVWGGSASGNSNKLTLPPNLQPIRHAGATDDERLRILFVALTRARLGLHLTSATQTYNGKPTKRLKYFDEREGTDDSFQTMVLPEEFRSVRSEDLSPPELELLELDWRARHLSGAVDVDLRGLLSERLEKYQLSPTHLTDFINLEYAGPQRFYFKTILKFPETPLPDAQFGTAIHEVLEWLQHRTTEQGSVPATHEAIQYFRARMTAKRLNATRTALQIERGEKALASWMRQRSHIFTPSDVAEKAFHGEGVFVGEAHMSGRVDRLEIDPAAKTITVVDYKTGKSYDRWSSDTKLHRYRLQLYCYKLLIEGSNTYKDYQVTRGRLEFIEPDEQGRIHNLELSFNDSEIDVCKGLIGALWNHVQELNFPDTTAYPASVTGVKAFEQDLLAGTV
ncbi:MAG TPA: ATP-dependent DNA helicase [Candidatus Saccharimonadales bacterium]|nr:ATP-dependent DNA helicase [Candidatus Saccharimonadales bacterium]